MGISGNLKTMVLADLLQWLQQGQKTGTLVIENDNVEKRVVFDNGAITASASTDPTEYLGHFLISNGYLTEEQVESALARQKTEGALLGSILVEMQMIAEEDLHQMLRLKAEESIYNIFMWEEGDFRFLDGEMPEKAMLPMNLDVQWIVLEGSRRLDEWARIREQIPHPKTVPVMLYDLDSLQEYDETELRLLAYVDDDSTVEEISQASHTTLFQVAQVLARYVEQGIVKAVRPRFIEVPVEVEAPQQSQQPQQLPPQPAPQQPAYAPPPTYAPPASGIHNIAPQPSGVHSIMPQPSGVHSIAPQPSGVHTLPPQPGPAASYPPQQAAAAASAPPIPAGSEAEQRIEEATTLIAMGDLERAFGLLKQARQAPGADGATLALSRTEEALEGAFERDGVKLSAVPRLACDMQELTQLKISPQEGFLLTRLTGNYDIKSLLKLSPMPKLEALMLFWRLKQSKHVAF